GLDERVLFGMAASSPRDATPEYRPQRHSRRDCPAPRLTPFVGCPLDQVGRHDLPKQAARQVALGQREDKVPRMVVCVNCFNQLLTVRAEGTLSWRPLSLSPSASRGRALARPRAVSAHATSPPPPRFPPVARP